MLTFSIFSQRQMRIKELKFCQLADNIDCFSYNIYWLDLRFRCNIESAVKRHHNLTTCLLIHTGSKNKIKSISKDLKSLGNQTMVLPLDLNYIFQHTPLEDWWQEDLQFTLSKWKTYHISEAARLAFLWKYGGLYLDHDTMILKPTSGIGENFIGLQSMKEAGTSVLKFTRNHPFLTKWLYLIPSNFNEDGRKSIGSSLATKILAPFCQGEVPAFVKDFSQVAGKYCDFNLHVLTDQVFYPIPKSHWEDLFAAKDTIPFGNSTFGVHLWHDLNHLKYKALDDIHFSSLYSMLAKSNCPETFKRHI